MDSPGFLEMLSLTLISLWVFFFVNSLTRDLEIYSRIQIKNYLCESLWGESGCYIRCGPVENGPASLGTPSASQQKTGPSHRVQGDLGKGQSIGGTCWWRSSFPQHFQGSFANLVTSSWINSHIRLILLKCQTNKLLLLSKVGPRHRSSNWNNRFRPD